MPHNPTSSGPPQHIPTTCWCCGRRAHGIGIGSFGRDGTGDPKFLCEACLMIGLQIKEIRRFDKYEENAVDMAIEAVGPLVEANGSDLAGWEMEQVREFVSQIILSFGDAIREQVRTNEVPF